MAPPRKEGSLTQNKFFSHLQTDSISPHASISPTKFSVFAQKSRSPGRGRAFAPTASHVACFLSHCTLHRFSNGLIPNFSGVLDSSLPQNLVSLLFAQLLSGTLSASISCASVCQAVFYAGPNQDLLFITLQSGETALSEIVN